MWVLRVFFPSSYLLAVAYQHTPIIKPSHGQSPVAVPIERCFSNEKKAVPAMFNSGWWFQTFFIFHFIYGMSSFPLTFIFFRGAETTNQNLIYQVPCYDTGDHTSPTPYRPLPSRSTRSICPWGYPIAGWFRMERPIMSYIKMDDLGVPPIWGNLQINAWFSCFTMIVMAMKIPWIP